MAKASPFLRDGFESLPEAALALMVVVGLPENETPLGASSLINARRSLAGSVIGGIGETQELLDFYSKHNIAKDIELIPAEASMIVKLIWR